jgi:hypothetical protein
MMLSQPGEGLLTPPECPMLALGAGPSVGSGGAAAIIELDRETPGRPHLKPSRCVLGSHLEYFSRGVKGMKNRKGTHLVVTAAREWTRTATIAKTTNCVPVSVPLPSFNPCCLGSRSSAGCGPDRVNVIRLVSILVVLDLGHRPGSACGIALLWRCFNPCCLGSRSSARLVCCYLGDTRWRFNPCCLGSRSSARW